MGVGIQWRSHIRTSSIRMQALEEANNTHEPQGKQRNTIGKDFKRVPCETYYSLYDLHCTPCALLGHVHREK